MRLRKYEESRDLQKNAISDNAQIETKKRNRLKERNRERETEREIAKGSLRSVFYVGTIPKPELFQFLGL